MALAVLGIVKKNVLDEFGIRCYAKFKDEIRQASAARIQDALNKYSEAPWYGVWEEILYWSFPVANVGTRRIEVFPYPQLPAKTIADIDDGQLLGPNHPGAAGNNATAADSAQSEDVITYNSTRIADIVGKVFIYKQVGGGTRGKLEWVPRVVLCLEAKNPSPRHGTATYSFLMLSTLMQATYERQVVEQVEHYKAEDARISVLPVLITYGDCFYYKEIDQEQVKRVRESKEAKARATERSKEGPDYLPPVRSPPQRRGARGSGKLHSPSDKKSEAGTRRQVEVGSGLSATALELKRLFGEKWFPEVLFTYKSDRFMYELLPQRIAELATDMSNEAAINNPLTRMEHFASKVCLPALEHAFKQGAERAKEAWKTKAGV